MGIGFSVRARSVPAGGPRPDATESNGRGAASQPAAVSTQKDCRVLSITSNPARSAGRSVMVRRGPIPGPAPTSIPGSPVRPRFAIRGNRDGNPQRTGPPARRDHADDGAGLPLPDDDDLRRQYLDPRRGRDRLDHPRAGGQGPPDPRRHRERSSRRDDRRTAPAVVGVPVSQGHLRGTPRTAGDRSCPPGRPGGLQHLRSRARYPAAADRPSRVRRGRLCTVRPAGQRGPGPQYRRYLRPGNGLCRAGEPRRRDRRDQPAARRSSGSRPWSSAPRPSSRPARSAR